MLIRTIITVAVFMFNCQAYGQNFVYAESIDRLIEYFDSIHVEFCWNEPYRLSSKERKRKKRRIKELNERRNFWTTAMTGHEKDLLFNADTLYIIYLSGLSCDGLYRDVTEIYSSTAYSFRSYNTNKFIYKPFPSDEFDEIIYNWDKELFRKIRDESIERPRYKSNTTYYNIYRIIKNKIFNYEYDFEYFEDDFHLNFMDYSYKSYINKYLK